MSDTSSPPSSEQFERIKKLLDAANDKRDQGDDSSRQEALQIYSDAISLVLDISPDTADNDLKNLGANVWTNHGIALLEVSTKESLEEAVKAFDKAIALRATLPKDGDVSYRWGLVASYMNKADVLTRLSGKENLEIARDSYDEAISLLRNLPLDENPTYPARLAVALMNRGITLQEIDGPDAKGASMDSFNQSIQLLNTLPSPLHPEQRRILACCLLNRGHLYLNMEPPAAESSRLDAQQVGPLMEEFEKREIFAAQIGLQARHLLCRSLGYMADHGFKDMVQPEDWVGECTDAVDEGLELVRHWRRNGDNSLSGLGTELFRYGALVYRLCQPHFLAEFLQDNLDPERTPGADPANKAMHHIATQAIWDTTEGIHGTMPRVPNDTIRTKLVNILSDLQEADNHLATLREKHLPPETAMV